MLEVFFMNQITSGNIGSSRHCKYVNLEGDHLESRRERSKRPRKKRRGLKIFIIAVVLLLAAGAVYSAVQYRQGLKEASDGHYGNDGEMFGDFNGSKVKGTMNVLLIGNDTRDGEHGRSDTLMIGHYNPKTNQTKLVSIMRDTYVDIPGHGMNKINAAFSYGGPELLRQTIKENFGIDVNYYAVVDFKGFPKLIDLLAPDGVEVDIPEQMSYGIGMTLNPGRQVLHGDKLLGYVRFRHDQASDFGRVKRQQEVLTKVKDQAMRAQNVLKLPKLLGMADPYIDTNMGNGTLFQVGKGMLSNKSGGMETLRVPVEGSYWNERTAAGAVLAIDLAKNKEALQSFLAD